MIKPSDLNVEDTKTRPQTDLVIRFKWTNRSKFYRSHKLINCQIAIKNLLPIKWGTIS